MAAEQLGPQFSSFFWHGIRDRALPRSGGFSIDRKGSSPTTGYMVSDPEHEERTPYASLTAEHLADYSSRHGEALARPGAHHGGWVEGGHLYQDISRRHENWGRAYASMVTHGQAGLYDVGGTGHPDSNPVYDRSSSESPTQRQMRATGAMAGHPLARSPEFSPGQVLQQSATLSKQFGTGGVRRLGQRGAA